MKTEKTLSIIKPDATKRNITGAINNIIESSGLKIIAQKRILLTELQAKNFYDVHKDKNFFTDLVQYMTSGPVVVQVLEGENAVQLNRDLMGSTNPQEALPGTIRADFANSIDANAVHGSDSTDSAKREIEYFFTSEEILNK